MINGKTNPQNEYLREVLDPYEFNNIENLFNNNKDWIEVFKVHKVVNNVLERRFSAAVDNLLGSDQPNIVRKFHGSRATSSVIANGFNLPDRPGMYGRGIYFASDSGKSSLFTSNREIMLCKVALGKYRTMDAADNSLDYAKVRSQGYDSVFARPHSRGRGGVMRDEFVVYDPDLAVPEYVVSFKYNYKSNVTGLLFAVACLLMSTLIAVCMREVLYLIQFPINFALAAVFISLSFITQVLAMIGLTPRTPACLPFLVFVNAALIAACILTLPYSYTMHQIEDLLRHKIDIESSNLDPTTKSSMACLSNDWVLDHNRTLSNFGVCFTPLKRLSGPTGCKPFVLGVVNCTSVYTHSRIPPPAGGCRRVQNVGYGAEDPILAANPIFEQEPRAVEAFLIDNYVSTSGSPIAGKCLTTPILVDIVNTEAVLLTKLRRSDLPYRAFVFTCVALMGVLTVVVLGKVAWNFWEQHHTGKRLYRELKHLDEIPMQSLDELRGETVSPNNTAV